MATKISHVRATPLYGGRSETGVCTLLEVGGVRILLDCGAALLGLSPDETQYAHKLASDLVAAGGVDAIILSHADLHHVGLLPILAGVRGLQKVPIIASFPVMKFAQLVLYDYISNLEMEGEDESGKKITPYSFDDIDHAFQHTIKVKFSQKIAVPETRAINPQDRNKRLPVFVTAIAAGRTIGGSIWRIQCGPAEIVYCVDANLRKEVVLDGVNMDLLPSAPVLMITDASCASRSTAGTLARKKRDKDDMQVLLQTVMATVRSGGNVLIPVESSARIQELLLAFAKYWAENKLGLYHLIFLSHMSRNVMEYSSMLLEWMSDSLTRPFYNGKANPMELPQVKCVTEMKTLDKVLLGPKVVFATDASLSVGLGKEVLLRWGGDPRCKVIFTEVSDKNSLAHLLRTATVPIIATVNKVSSVELSGQELIDFKLEMERKRKLEEEESIRKKRQLELSQFTATQEDIQGDEDDDENGDGQQRNRKKFKLSALWKILDNNIQMFEKKHPAFSVMDEYGCGIDDLKLMDIQGAEARLLPIRDRHADGRSQPRNVTPSPAPVATVSTSTIPTFQIPHKLQHSPQKVQFTCEILTQAISTGRMDFKGFKALLSRVTPNKLLIIKGAAEDFNSVMAHCKTNGIECYAPQNRHSVTFSMHTDHLQIHIPHHLLPKHYAKFTKSAASSLAGDCTVYSLQGDVMLTAQSWSSGSQEGSRLLRYQGAKSIEDDQEEDGAPELFKQLLHLEEERLGAVSVGEVTLNQLKQAYEGS
eukprot:gene30625-37002_t